jgi:glycosyltransferase involved in cell wall biosynthesis
MRILMLAQFYPPIIGGEERHVRDLSIALAARGHDVAVATLWQEGIPAFECDQGVRIHRVRGSLQRATAIFAEKERRHAPPFPDPEVLWALRRIIKHERPDIIHAHNWIVHSFTPIKSLSKTKLVVTLHDCSFVCAQKRFMHHGVLCDGPTLTKCLKCASDYYGAAKGIPTVLANWVWGGVERRTVDMFLPVSRAMADVAQLAKHQLPYRVVPNFVPNDLGERLDDANPLIEQLPTGDFLLFVGDLVRDKGVEVLLRAYAAMECQLPLVLIGRPVFDFPANLPPNVLVLPKWPHDAIMSAWRRCTIALLPSICLESFGIVILEAMAMGRPVVASRIGGIPDIVVDGETGLLVPPGDALALRQALQSLLDDPARRERMGALAKERVAQFQSRTVVPRIEQVYQEVLQS